MKKAIVVLSILGLIICGISVLAEEGGVPCTAKAYCHEGGPNNPGALLDSVSCSGTQCCEVWWNYVKCDGKIKDCHVGPELE